MKKAVTILAVAGMAAFGLAACGGDDDSSSSSDEDTVASASTAAPATAGETVTITADPDGALEFTAEEVDAKAGAATIELDNPATTSHDLVVESEDGSEVGATEVISQSTDSFTAELQPGAYKFYCSLPGHTESMTGTLNVK